ncbi:MAG: hypothetical protein FJ253_01425 [Phycisphaerae bacterium]|nr:hypothetical protein [Phycisphaerae bacterium]
MMNTLRHPFTLGALAGTVALALSSHATAQVITTNITVTAPIPGMPLQTWVDVNPGVGGTQRCTLETTPMNQVITPPGMGPIPCDLIVDVRLMNAAPFPPPGLRLVGYHFTIVYDPSVVMPAPGLVSAPTFAGTDPFPGVSVPPGFPLPQAAMRVVTAVDPCPGGTSLGGLLITPAFNALMARLGFIVVGEGQTGFDVTDIEIYTTPNMLPCAGVGMMPGDDLNARSQCIVNYAGPAVGCWTVNVPFGMPDFMPGNGISDGNPMLGLIDSTLSACITEANARAGADGIGFDFQPPLPPPLPPIAVPAAMPLPAISDATGGLYINGNSQPGTGIAGGAPTGFTITSASNTIRELAVLGFGTSGITIAGVGATANRVIGCRIGVDWLGAASANWNGVEITDGASGNMIGDTGAGEGNLISGNTFDGVFISAGAAADSPNNSVRNCLIGTNATGLAAMPNAEGVDILGCSGTIVGGPGANDGNLISGNMNTGVRISLGCTNTLVQGNMIGLNDAGTAALGNAGAGIAVIGANTNTIGGATSAHGNTISGNGGDGIAIVVGDGNLVYSNRIGVIPLGTLSIGNAADGVSIVAANANRVGAVGRGNVISGNTAAGVRIDVGSVGNLVQSNHIGVDVAGTFELANDIGVVITGASDLNHIGGGSVFMDFGIEAEGNILSGNTQQGVLIELGSAVNTVARNRIGIGPADQPESNGASGIWINGGSNSNWVAYNRIASNFINGVRVTGVGSDDNTIVDNDLGLPGIPNLENGVRVELGPLNTGIATNRIKGNAESGVYVTDSGTDGTTIFNNSIVLNQAFGVLVEDGPGATLVLTNELGSNGVGAADFGGGGTQVLNNVIVGNDDAGVLGGALRISQNSIYDNEELGIDLSFVPVFVLIEEAGLADGLVVSGTLTGTAGVEHTIEVFLNDACDASGFGEGKTFLGSGTATPGGDGTTEFAVAVDRPDPLRFPLRVSVTGTRGMSVTSEFSNCFEITGTEKPLCPADFNDDGQVDGDDLGTLLGMWGPCVGCVADFNDDFQVDGDDLGTLLGEWGPCPI